MLIERSFDTGELILNIAESKAAGSPLVMLHGSTLHWQSFEELIPTLEQCWHIYACDLRGHGKSGRAKSGYSYDSFVLDTTAFIEHNVGEPVVLLGFSLGASIALGVAARLPGLVRALVLLDPALSFFRDSDLQSFPAHEWYTWLNQTLTSAHSFEDVMARCKERAPDDDEAATLSFAQMVHNLDPQSIANMLNNQTFKDYKPEQLLPQVVCPTLLVYGETRLGSVMNDSDVEFFKKHILQGTTIQVKDVGHEVIWGSPGQAALERITQFLNSL
jgi:pimeloyl-ACP methyl ester carboxylesterase